LIFISQKLGLFLMTQRGKEILSYLNIATTFYDSDVFEEF
jgi:hypothetical protein